MEKGETRKGLLYAISAFGFWGFVPVYFKALSHVPAMEVLAHRIFWSVPVTGIFLTLGGNWGRLVSSLRDLRVVGGLLLSSILVVVNWLVFILAVQTGRIMEASLGYYINPLVNVLLGNVFLGERLRRTQVVAVILAAGGTGNLVIAAGVVPWVAFILAGSFGLYGLVRKKIPVEPVDGLFVETLLMAPLALGYLIWLGLRARICFGLVDMETTVLLASAGAVTALPLVWFTHGARRLTLTTLGLAQYLAPTLQFLLGVVVYGEALSWPHVVAFCCIWTGVGLFILEARSLGRALKRKPV